MPDWTKSMQETFEYYTVDPGTWRDVKKLDNVKSCTITRDSEVETLGSATIDFGDPISECYVRVYLVTIQNGLRERHPLGTFLVQTPNTEFDGKRQAISVDAYTPLIELKESPPPLGFSIFKDSNIMDFAYDLTKDHARAPVVKPSCKETIYYDFVANTDDTWMSFLSDLVANAKYTFGLDDMGRILFLPVQDTASLQPVWTYTDDGESILYPEISTKHDLFNIPNTVEVIYSNGSDNYYAKAVNDDPNSPISTINRGREIVYRDMNPSLSGLPNEEIIQEYAEQLLRELSCVEFSISYTHGYCPVRLGDCVRINYTRAGSTDIKAKVISQTIKCSSGCSVKEKAVFTTKLWG